MKQFEKREEEEMFQEIISQMKTSADLLRHTKPGPKALLSETIS